MNVKHNRKLWVDALRSGEYKQTVECLQDKEGYCCLGVACDVYEKATGGKLPRKTNGFYDDNLLEGDFETVKDWLGLRLEDGDTFEKGKSLVAMNDDGKSFSDIARFIESKPEGLFVQN